MDEIIKRDSDTLKMISNESDLAETSKELLLDARTDVFKANTMSIPIAQLATLGAGVSSLLPSLRTVTQTTTVNTQGLYQLANAAVGDTLKVAKNGNFWGAFKTAEGTSKFAQLQAAGPLSATNKMVMPINPATMLMAVALFSIEQQLGNIAETGKQILSFLEVEKESEIEANAETLISIIAKYKHNWDNEYFVSSNHTLVLDIQRTARKHMNSYQKKIGEVLDSKKRIMAQAKMDTALTDLQKKFKYYRLSLYTFSLASLVEILLSGNFKEAYISCVKTEIETLSLSYRELFDKCSVYLEKMRDSSLKANVLTGIGTASSTVGKFIGEIPVIKKGPIDELLQDNGSHLKKKADKIEHNMLASFAKLSNPETGTFVNQMENMIQIYNHTERICFDHEQIYLLAE